jgi:hypothetical protein
MEVDQLAESLKNVKMPTELTFGGLSHTPKFRPRTVRPGGPNPKSGMSEVGHRSKGHAARFEV